MIDKDFEADTFFYQVDLDQWKLVEREDIAFDDELGFSYSFLTYEK
jgi:hypothetical protein